MSTREDELLLLLSKLVVPHYPVLKGTDIPLVAAGECARRGTPEQRKTARDARAIMEEIWELGEDVPVRKLLEALERSHGRVEGKASDAVELKAQTSREIPSAGHRLPTEVLRSIWRNAIVEPGPDPTPFPDSVGLVVFGTLRLVSKAVLEHAESVHKRVATRFVSRVARHLLHVAGPKSKALFVKNLCSCTALFGRAREISVLQRSQEVEGINQLFSLCHNIVVATIYTVEDKPVFNGLDLRHNPLLHTLNIVGAIYFDSLYEEPAMTWQARDLWHDSDTQNHASQWYGVDSDLYSHCGPPKLPPALRTLHFDTRDVNAPAAMDDLDVPELEETHSLLSLCSAGEKLETVVCRDNYPWEKLANEVCRAGKIRVLKMVGAFLYTENLTRALKEGGVALEELDISGNYLSIAPDITKFPSLIRLTLGWNALRSWSMQLANHKTLRFLDLSHSFSMLAPSRPALIAQFSVDFALNETLEELDLGHNKLTNDDLAVIKIGRHKALRKLSLVMNQITDAGLSRLELKGNGSLREIDMRGHGVDGLSQPSRDAARRHETAKRRIVTGPWAKE